MEDYPSPPPDYMNAVGLLNRREIEARMLAPLINALYAEFDHQRVLEVVRKVIQDISRRQGAQLAESMEANDL